MTGLVLELQREAIESGTKVSDLLRKAYVVARKLDVDLFKQWIQSEQNGYEVSDKPPNYRNIPSWFEGTNPYTNGRIPVIGFDSFEVPIRQSISELEVLADSENAFLNIPINYELQRALSKATAADKSVLFDRKVATNSIISLIDRVRNEILEWSLKLEENGIIGEGLSFTKEEKENAKSPVIQNHIINIYGNVTDSQIGQDTCNSVQKK
jgi:hypothetical protein